MKNIFAISFIFCVLCVANAQNEKDTLKINQLENVWLTYKRFVNIKSQSATKLPLKDIESPQVYNSITSTLISDQLSTNFDDVFSNVPGVSQLWQSTGRAGTGHGGSSYYSLRGFSTQPQLQNGMPGIANNVPDVANIENVEVIKGPSSSLYPLGLTSYGGLININTKKPYKKFGGNVNVTAGSFNLYRGAVDINIPLTDDKKTLFRLNSAYQTQNSFQDYGYKKSFLFAPTLTYKVNEKLNFFIMSEIYTAKATNPLSLFFDRGSPLKIKNIKQLKGFRHNRKRSYTSDDLYLTNPVYNLQGLVNYKIDKNWKSQTSISLSSSESSGDYSYLYESSATVEKKLGRSVDGLIYGRYTAKMNATNLATGIQQNFLGDFKIGNIRNRMLIGGSYYKIKSQVKSSKYVGQGSIYIGKNLPLFKSIASTLGASSQSAAYDDTGILTRDYLSTVQTIPDKAKVSYQRNFSAYALDMINILPNLSVMAGIGLQNIKTKNYADSKGDYHKTVYSPRFGIVYQPILNKVSLFAGFQNGVLTKPPVSERVNSSVKLRTLKPERANQLEFGTKLALFKGKLLTTLSYYNIDVTDKNYVIYVNSTDYYYKEDGKQTNKGFELSVNAIPVKGLNLTAGYSYNYAKLNQGDPSLKGLRPIEAGPKNLTNVWASYRFQDGLLKNFGIGFGGNYASENKVYNLYLKGVLQTFTLDAYTLLNASVFYDTDKFRIALKVNNLTDKDYYIGWSTLTPMAGFNFATSLQYRF